MLAPNDIHYVVGMLTLVSTPKSAEVELGEPVLDNSTLSKRDVDITIKYRDSFGLLSAVIGREVKAIRDHLLPNMLNSLP